MGKYNRIVKQYKIVGNPQWNLLEISLNYEIGGMNYFTGTSQARGLQLSCTPLQKVEGGTVSTMFSGTYKHVLDLKRFSAKTLREYEPSLEDYEAVKNHVIKKHYLEIEELDTNVS